MGTKDRPLLSAGFLERLEALRDVLFRRRLRGELEGSGAGQAPEFDTHRPYEPGDEPRYIDWNIYARLEKLLLKMYVQDDETRVSVLLDCSGSMRSSGRKGEAALKMAAAFSYLALAGNHHLALGAFADHLLAAAGPYRSPDHFGSCLAFLGHLPRGRGTDIASGASEFLAGRAGPHFLVLISDLFQEGDVPRALDLLRMTGADLHLVQVVDDSEIRLDLRGEYTLADVEGEERVSLFVSGDLHARFQERVDRYQADLERCCRERGIPRLLVPASRDVETLLLGHLLRRGEGEGRQP